MKEEEFLRELDLRIQLRKVSYLINYEIEIKFQELACGEFSSKALLLKKN